VNDAGLFDGLYATGTAAGEVSDAAWLQALLDFEVALARGGETLGRVPAAAADAIAAAAVLERFDAGALGRAAAEHATVAVPLVAALRESVGSEHADHVHAGATSQDALDTALVLVSRRAAALLSEDAWAVSSACAALARRHAGTAMIGRTLMQRAVPVSFGVVAAGWALGVAEAAQGLAAQTDGLWVQLGGPVGAEDPELTAAVAAELGLAAPPLPWHTRRTLPARLAAALGVLAGAVGKLARDVTLLAADEVGEVRDGVAGASTAMAQKRNPVAAVSVLACTRRTPALVGTMLQCMEQEHQRAAGAWQAEWGTLTELWRLTGSAAAWSRRLLSGLEVDASRMRANLDRAAREGVEAAADPAPYLAHAGALVQRALTAVGERP
jgi:3-carboxy-cis,cis-muconate cycloisomerase